MQCLGKFCKNFFFSNFNFFCLFFSLNPFQAPENAIKVAPVEVASEVCEENVQYKTNMSSPSEPSEASSCKRRDLVSMVTFK